MLKELKNIDSKVLISNPYWDYCIDKYRLPDDTISEYHYVDSRGSTFIIPLFDRNHFIMTKQYRYLNKRFSIEFPGGGTKKNLNPIENAICELREETGFSAKEMVKLGEFNPFNGVTNEICTVFLAKNLELVGAQPDQSEQFEIISMSIEQIQNKIIVGEIWDGMTLAAWTLFFLSDYAKL